MLRNNIARLTYTAVFISNLICIIAFIFNPADYTYSYGVSGCIGSCAAIQGLGVAFAMWNTTYPFFIIRPDKNKTLGLVIILQQLVGLIGELYIRSTLSADAAVLSSSILRFVYFDAGGLVLLVAGYAICFIAVPRSK